MIDRSDPEKDKYKLLVRGIFVNVLNGYRRCCCMHANTWRSFCASMLLCVAS